MQKLSNFLGVNLKPREEVSLPSRFAQQVLDLELEIESNPNIDMQSVNRLIELYSIAVEYYETIKSSKYLVFKNKITKLLLNPLINRTMENNAKDAYLFGEDTSKQNNEQKKRELENSLLYATQNTQGDVRTMLMAANDRSDNVNKMINSGILIQEYTIRERLSKRKKSKKDQLSRDSTESDPKEQIEISESGSIKAESEVIEPIEEKPQLDEESMKFVEWGKQSAETEAKPKPVQVKPVEKILTPEEVFIVKLQKIQKKKKRRLLKVKGNEKDTQLPEEYSIPF